MARLLIRQAHTGEFREIGDGALPYFLNMDWVVIDTIDDSSDSPPLYLSKEEGDARWLKFNTLNDANAPEVEILAENIAASATLRAALVPRPTGGTDGQALVKSGSAVAWGPAGLTADQIDAAVGADLGDLGTAVGAAAAALPYQPISQRALVANLPNKVYSAHRGYGQVAPENTMEGFHQAFASGAHDINIDTWPLSDGVLICLHDATLDFATTSRGNVADIDSSAAQQLVVDAGNWFGGSWGNLKAPLFSEVAAAFGNRMPMQLQAKPAAGSGAALVAACAAYGIRPNAARIGSFSLVELQPAINAGFECMLVFNNTTYASADPAALAAQGISVVCLDRTTAAFATQAAKNAEVARWHAAGIKVQIYSPLRRCHTWPWLIAGADEFAADEPLYQRPDWVPRTTDPFKSGNFFHGMIGPVEVPAARERGYFVGSIGTSARWSQYGNGFTVQGWGAPISAAVETTLRTAVSAGATSIRVGPENKPKAGIALNVGGETVTPTGNGVYDETDGSYVVPVPALTAGHAAGARVYGGTITIETDIVYDNLGSDTARWPGVAFCSPDDRIYSDGIIANNDRGYLFALRGNGQLMVSGRLDTTAIAGAPTAVNSTAISAPLVLSAGLTAGVAITSLPVNALATAVVAGQRFFLPTGQIAVASGSAAIAATSLPINSLTPAAAVATASSIPQVVRLRLQRTATAVSCTRLDTGTTLTWNDTTFFGGYFHFGQNIQATAAQFTWANAAISA